MAMMRFQESHFWTSLQVTADLHSTPPPPNPEQPTSFQSSRCESCRSLLTFCSCSCAFTTLASPEGGFWWPMRSSTSLTQAPSFPAVSRVSPAPCMPPGRAAACREKRPHSAQLSQRRFPVSPQCTSKRGVGVGWGVQPLQSLRFPAAPPKGKAASAPQPHPLQPLCRIFPSPGLAVLRLRQRRPIRLYLDRLSLSCECDRWLFAEHSNVVGDGVWFSSQSRGAGWSPKAMLGVI